MEPSAELREFIDKAIAVLSRCRAMSDYYESVAKIGNIRKEFPQNLRGEFIKYAKSVRDEIADCKERIKKFEGREITIQNICFHDWDCDDCVICGLSSDD